MRTVDPDMGEVATMASFRPPMIIGRHTELGGVASTPPFHVGEIPDNYESIKRWVEVALALVMLLALSPLILLLMALVRLTSRGSAIYSQQRLGFGGSIFTIYKIRTMYDDSERDSGAKWAVPGDPRITWLGRILRWTHLDELPQLVNVLKGEMSLVGPRPERPEVIEKLDLVRKLPDYHRRLTVRPGVTGLAQIQQPPDVDVSCVRRKLNYDLCYVEQMDPWLDLRVIFGTVLKCVGVPLPWIGRILRLPDPNADSADEALPQGTGPGSKAIAPDSCLG